MASSTFVISAQMIQQYSSRPFHSFMSSRFSFSFDSLIFGKLECDDHQQVVEERERERGRERGREGEEKRKKEIME